MGLALLLMPALIPLPASAQVFESFEYGVPPPGWTKTNLQGGSGWFQLPSGIAPLSGWGNGTSSVPPTAGAGVNNAYCTWNTGGSAAQGYHNDQWLISPRLTGLTATSTVSYWLRFAFTNYPDEVRFRISTAGPAPANFTIVALTNIFAKGSWPSQFPPWNKFTVNLGAFGIAPGTPIWVAVQEYVWDNTWNGAAIQLDVVTSDLTAAPEPRANPTSLTFTAYYEGADPAPQTFSIQSIGSSGMGFSRTTTFGAGPTNWLTMGGPLSETLAFQNSQTFTARVSVTGLDLGTYGATNIITVPGATNTPLRVPITFRVIRRPQTITFPNPGAKFTTNKVGLAGTSSSGLPVTFSIYSGPGAIVGATNLSFTGTGIVKVIGWQLGNIYYDVAPSITNSIAVTKPSATILFTNLSHVYDGSPHGATVTTVPPGLTVDTTYNGSPSLPIAIGSYAVTSSVNDTLYGGSAVATFTITRMVQTINFPDPGPQWTTNRVGLAATANSGLPASFSVASGPGSIADGTNLTFYGAGTVTVVASHPGDANWLPAAATNPVEVTKATASVTLNNLSQAYDGTPRVVTATTVPAGLTVDLTYDGGVTAPIAAGSYAVTGTVSDVIYQGMNAGTLTISRADQALTFPDLQPRLTNAVVALGATASSGLPVTEFEVVSGPGLIDGTNLSFSGVGDVLVAARQGGNGNWNAAPAVTNLIKAFSVNPPGGPAAGGNEVLITNGRIGDGASVTNVTLCGTAATILEQGTNWVSVQCGPGTPGTGDVVIQSDGDLVISNAYTVNPTGTIFAVDPFIGSYIGGFPVVITGSNLSDGTDVTNVTLCGVPAAVVSQSSTQIVVTAGAGDLGLGDVRIFSVSFGETVGPDAFTYAIPEMTVLSAGGEVIVSGEAAAPSKGTDFGDQLVLSASTNWFGITNGGAASLYISVVTTNGAESGFFTASGVPAGVPPGGSAFFSIVYAPPTVGVHSAALWLANDSTATPYQINLAGVSRKRDQEELIFTPASPQTYNTTNTLSTTGGSGLGAVTYSVEAGAAQRVGDDGLWVTAGTGSVTVVATKASDALYNATATTATVNAAKADQAITFDAMADQETTNVVGLAATADSGFLVAFSVEAPSPAVITDGTNLTFTGTGTVRIVAGQAGDDNWNAAPEVTNTFEVGKAVAGIALNDLTHVYDGSAKAATVVTVPAGLVVDVTYDGSATPPTDVGTYAVTGVVDDVMYEGTVTGLLEIVQGGQTITFAPIPRQKLTNALGLAATASSGLPVTFVLASGPAVLAGGTNLSFTAYGTVVILASQAGDANWSPAPNVTNTFRVMAGLLGTDYNGDGISDLAVYNAAAARWYIRRIDDTNAPPIAYDLPWGGATMDAVPGDYDGNGLSDPAAYEERTGLWYIRRIGRPATPICFGQEWGGEDLVPAPGDYNGDGIFDLAVYDVGAGNWYIRSLGNTSHAAVVFGMPWGGAGMVPVSGDYDGDGFSDLAVYDESAGFWYIRKVNDTNAPPICFGMQWGGPGLVAVSGDYDGDSVFDLAVYEVSTGLWYIRSLRPAGAPICFGMQWGGSGTMPVVGDYNGDGIYDLSVYDESTGAWFIRKLNTRRNAVILFGNVWGGVRMRAVGMSD